MDLLIKLSLDKRWENNDALNGFIWNCSRQWVGEGVGCGGGWGRLKTVEGYVRGVEHYQKPVAQLTSGAILLIPGHHSEY